MDNLNDSLVYYIALKNADVPVEMHQYARGGHAFGLRRMNLPITDWRQVVEAVACVDKNDFGRTLRTGVVSPRATS